MLASVKTEDKWTKHEPEILKEKKELWHTYIFHNCVLVLFNQNIIKKTKQNTKLCQTNPNFIIRTILIWETLYVFKKLISTAY